MTDLNFQLLEPDYRRPLSAIYEDFAVSMIPRSNSLMVLTSLLHVNDTIGWPLWVPNLSNPGVRIDQEQAISSPLFWSTDDCEASGSRFRPIFQLVHQPGRLMVEGTQLGAIVSIGSILYQPLEEQWDDKKNRGLFIFDASCWVEDLLTSAKDEVFPDGTPHRSAFYETLDFLETVYPVVGVRERGFGVPRLLPTSVRDLDMFDEFINDYGHILKEHRVEAEASDNTEGNVLERTSRAAASLFDTINPVKKTIAGVLIIMAELYHPSPMRVPLVLSNGCVGMGYLPNYKFGDIVTFMYGSHLPIVVRRCGDDYRFIGPAVIKGVPGDLWPLEHGKDQGEVELMTLV